MKDKPLSAYMKEMEVILEAAAQQFSPQEIFYFLQAVEQKKDWIAWEYLVGQMNQTQKEEEMKCQTGVKAC